jgi:hypothetical protein
MHRLGYRQVGLQHADITDERPAGVGSEDLFSMEMQVARAGSENGARMPCAEGAAFAAQSLGLVLMFCCMPLLHGMPQKCNTPHTMRPRR